jgi:hypothetical protein
MCSSFDFVSPFLLHLTVLKTSITSIVPDIFLWHFGQEDDYMFAKRQTCFGNLLMAFDGKSSRASNLYWMLRELHAFKG